MRSKKINKIFLKEKVSTKCFINQTKTPLTCQNLFLNEKKVFLPKKHQTAVHVTISRSNGRNETQATKFNFYQFQFRKSYQYPLRRVEVRSKVRLPARDFPIFYYQLAVATFLAIKRSDWYYCYERLRNFLIFWFVFCVLALVFVSLRSTKTIGAPTAPHCKSWWKKSLDVGLSFMQECQRKGFGVGKMAVWSYCGWLAIVAMFFF